ncbi:hypothetical protein VP01_4360g1 [Puccinia sorghi]|uniref:Retrovirus-related Pol polyprotein from transposon TNT 1-94-like beta-barrel domain-containing protein n=1 Tax=Puccinia sorghi TaxID=27349 RepID=A0A0L6UPT2_9BASI|nr:hypothetical protein VP01_4360g1 [Puccinia sorghi]
MKNRITTPTRCTQNYHNPKQDDNHTAHSCWHLHPDKAPDWWKEEQAKWKASKSEANYFMSLLTLWVEKGDNKSRIILDSGASAHIFNHERFFTQITRGEFDNIKKGKEDATLPIKGKGTERMKWGNRVIQLEDCLYVPDIVINLVSAGSLDKKGCQIHSEAGKFLVKKDGMIALEGKVARNLFTVNNLTSIGPTDREVHYTSKEDQIKEIHESYGHASIQRLGQMLPSQISNQDKLDFQCKSCVMSKIKKKPFNLSSQTVEKPWERIHLDLVGPIKPQSLGQHKYILTVTDNATGYLAGFPLTHKSNTADTLIRLLENEKKRIGYYPDQICSDGGGKFVGIRAERANRTIVESMRATFKVLNVKKNLWHYVVKSCCLALNQILKKGETLSPWEAMQEYKLPNNYLKPLGNLVIYLSNCWKKGEKFAEKGSEDGSIVDTKHVQFLKKNETQSSISSDLEKPLTIENEEGWSNEDENNQQSRWTQIRNQEGNNNQDSIDSKSESDTNQNNSTDDTSTQNSDNSAQIPEPVQQPNQIPNTRTLRDRSTLRPPVRYGFHHYYEPRTFKGAMRCDEEAKWLEAIEKEINSIESHKISMTFFHKTSKSNLVTHLAMALIPYWESNTKGLATQYYCQTLNTLMN